jgi:hypothetical protein
MEDNGEPGTKEGQLLRELGTGHTGHQVIGQPKIEGIGIVRKHPNHLKSASGGINLQSHPRWDTRVCADPSVAFWLQKDTIGSM